MKFRTGFEDQKEREAVGLAVALHCKDDSLTVQADAKEADINNIMSRYQKTGQLPPLQRLPSYGDFDQVSDFRSAIELVRAGEEQFSRLPAQVRSRFDNDAAAFMDFAANPDNLAEVLAMDILEPEVAHALHERAEKVKAENPTSGSAGGSAEVGSSGARPASGKGRAKSAEGGEDH